MRVSLRYRLFDAEGELVEESQEGETLALLLGYGHAAPKVEAALAGGCAGEVKTLKLRPAEAFGPRKPDRIVEFFRDEFPADLAVGDELEAEGSQGESVSLKIVELDSERVVVDTNHPLAGQAVSLELVLESVRPATPTEIEQSIERMQQISPAPAEQALLPLAALLRHLPQGANSGRSTPVSQPPTNGSAKRGKVP